MRSVLQVRRSARSWVFSPNHYGLRNARRPEAPYKADDQLVILAAQVAVVQLAYTIEATPPNQHGLQAEAESLKNLE